MSCDALLQIKNLIWTPRKILKYRKLTDHLSQDIKNHFHKFSCERAEKKITVLTILKANECRKRRKKKLKNHFRFAVMKLKGNVWDVLIVRMRWILTLDLDIGDPIHLLTNLLFYVLWFWLFVLCSLNHMFHYRKLIHAMTS